MFKKKFEALEISSEELKSKLDKQEQLTIIDVREPDEYEICHLKTAKLIPLRQIPSCLSELNPNGLTVLYCHHGIRSAQATLWFQKMGFENAKNLEGGIDAWAERIDPLMERY